MRRPFHLVLLPGLMLAAASCAGGSSEPAPTTAPEATSEAAATAEPFDRSAEVDAIRGVRAEYVAAANAGDAARIAALWTADGIDMPNHAAAAVGRDAIQKAHAARMAAMKVELALNGEETRVRGNRAFDRGTFTIRLTPTGGGPTVTDEGKYLVLLTKQTDGTWKLSHGISNSNLPMPTLPAPR
jgi:uncharacterized protein (TIGR02246 family)